MEEAYLIGLRVPYTVHVAAVRPLAAAARGRRAAPMDAWKAVAAVAGAGTAVGCAVMGKCGQLAASSPPYPYGYCLFDIDGTISNSR